MSRAFLSAAVLALGLATGVQARPLVLSLGAAPEAGFDPILGWAEYGAPLFQSTLLRRDAQMGSQPDLAQSWELSADRLTWTITLRPDVRFSDGTPLTAADVAFTFMAAKAGANARDLSMLLEAKALDPQKVSFTLSKPWITFSDHLHTLGIVPADRYDLGYGRTPLGSGPWRLVSWTEGEQLIAEPNPYYHGPESAFSRLTLLFGPPELGLAAARAGQADLVFLPAPLAKAEVEGFDLRSLPSVDVRGISLPFLPRSEEMGNDVTADPAIRRALNLGLDRDTLIKVALQGHGRKALGPMDGMPWAAQAALVYDPEAAIALLEAAGWVLHDGQVIRSRNGQPASFDLYYPAHDPARQALAQTFAHMILPLGIEAVPKGGSWDTIDRILHKQPVVFGFGSHAPDLLYDLFASDRKGSGYRNPTHYGTEEVDHLLAAAQGAPSLEASYTLWAEADRLSGVEGDNTYVWLAHLDHLYLTRQCLQLGPQALQPHGHGWPILASLDQWRWECP